MGSLEIILICLGIIVVIASFVLSDKLWGKDEDKDIKEQKAQLSAEMNGIFENHAKASEEKIREAAKAAMDSYVEEAKRAIEVAVNEAKEELQKLTAQAQEKMEACVTQTQEEAAGISGEAKDNIQAIAEEQQKKIQECTEQVITEINNHHNEVTVLYSMINTKQDELKKEVQLVEQVRNETKDIVCEAKDVVAEMESVKKQADVISQSAGDVREEFISEIKEELMQEFTTEDISKAVGFAETSEDKASEDKAEEQTNLEEQLEEVEPEPTKPIDAEEIKEVLQAMGQNPEDAQIEEFIAETEATIAVEGKEPEVVVADVEEIEEISVQTVKSAVEEVWEDVIAHDTKESSRKEESKERIQQETELKETASEEITSEEKTEEVVEEEPVKAEQGEEEELPEDIVVEEAPNKLLRAVRDSGTVSTEADFAMRKKVLAMYEKGHSSMEISQEVNLGIGEVRMIIDLYSRRER